MVNTLFASHLTESKGRFEVDGPMRQTTEIKEQQHGEQRHSGSMQIHVRLTTDYEG